MDILGAEGLERLRKYLKTNKEMNAELVAGMERSLGAQTITVGGVPVTSHFARVMVAADSVDLGAGRD